jgi:hypothetical protein
MATNFNPAADYGMVAPGTPPVNSNPYGTTGNPYIDAATATAQGNLTGARIATNANRVNQNTPYGSLNYTQGVDANGNPTWTANQTLSPELQKLTSSSLANLQGSVDKPMYGINPGETYSDAIMRRLQPTMQHQTEMSDQQLANQGIMPGSEAYNNAIRLRQQGQNDQMTSAIVGGMNTGINATTAANATAANIKGLSTPGYVNPYSQPATTGPDYLGAYSANNAANIAANNAGMARSAGNTAGLYSLGGAFLSGGGLNAIGSGVTGAYNWFNQPADYTKIMNTPGNFNVTSTGNDLTGGYGFDISDLTSSDIRMKENIELVGNLPSGLNIYNFEYKPEFKEFAGHGKFTGVMAQEVEKIIPNAVATMSNGYKGVKYSLIY